MIIGITGLTIWLLTKVKVCYLYLFVYPYCSFHYCTLCDNLVMFQNVVDPEVKTLLALKAEFKSVTGMDWKPGVAIPADKPAAAAAPPSGGSGDAASINQKIVEQGDKIRQLKSEKAAKVIVI